MCRAPITEPLPAVRPLLVTEHGRPIAHHVTDDEARAPEPQALCGRRFRPAGLTVPLGAPCPACLAWSGPTRSECRRGRRWPFPTRSRGRA